MSNRMKQAGTEPTNTGELMLKRTSSRRVAAQRIEEAPQTPQPGPFVLRVLPETVEGCSGPGTAESAPSCSRMIIDVDRPGHWEQRIWTPEQWATLSPDEQPPDAEVYCLIGGGYCHFREIEADQTIVVDVASRSCPRQSPNPAKARASTSRN